MTNATMALAELAEKGPDVDVLRQMVQFAAQRLMDMEAETLCGGKRGLDTLLTRSAPQTSTTGRSSANPTRQVVPSPGSMLAVRWLMRTTVPTTV